MFGLAGFDFAQPAGGGVAGFDSAQPAGGSRCLSGVEASGKGDAPNAIIPP